MKSIPKSFPQVDLPLIDVSEEQNGEVILNQSQLSTICEINVAHLTKALQSGRITGDLHDGNGKPFFFLRNLNPLKQILISMTQDEPHE